MDRFTNIQKQNTCAACKKTILFIFGFFKPRSGVQVASHFKHRPGDLEACSGYVQLRKSTNCLSSLNKNARIVNKEFVLECESTDCVGIVPPPYVIDFENVNMEYREALNNTYGDACENAIKNKTFRIKANKDCTLFNKVRCQICENAKCARNLAYQIKKQEAEKLQADALVLRLLAEKEREIVAQTAREQRLLAEKEREIVAQTAREQRLVAENEREIAAQTARAQRLVAENEREVAAQTARAVKKQEMEVVREQQHQEAAAQIALVQCSIEEREAASIRRCQAEKYREDEVPARRRRLESLGLVMEEEDWDILARGGKPRKLEVYIRERELQNGTMPIHKTKRNKFFK